jgi:hypothetical protein
VVSLVARAVAKVVARVRADGVAVAVMVVVAAMGHNFNFVRSPLFHWMDVGGGGGRVLW